jgi:hypothetical protein
MNAALKDEDRKKCNETLGDRDTAQSQEQRLQQQPYEKIRPGHTTRHTQD